MEGHGSSLDFTISFIFPKAICVMQIHRCQVLHFLRKSFLEDAEAKLLELKQILIRIQSSLSSD
jgi:hypothetical protein